MKRHPTSTGHLEKIFVQLDDPAERSVLQELANRAHQADSAQLVIPDRELSRSVGLPSEYLYPAIDDLEAKGLIDSCRASKDGEPTDSLAFRLSNKVIAALAEKKEAA